MTLTNTPLICTILVIFITFGKGDQRKAEVSNEEANEILPGRMYYWKIWCFCQDTEHLYIWSEMAALKMSVTSNGWFQFVIDDKLFTIYSDGELENETNPENEFQTLKSMINSTTRVQPILSHASSTGLVVGNWFLISRKEGEMTIQHTDKQHAFTTLRGNFPGFTFESNDNAKHKFSAKTSLGPEFSTSWIPGRKTYHLRSKVEALKPKTGHSNLTSCCMLRKKSANGLTEIQCHTKACFHNISYVWNIERIDLHRPVPVDKELFIKSPSFSSATYDNVKWYLELGLGHHGCDKISLFLFRCPNSLETRARVQYSVNFLDSKGNLMLTRRMMGLHTFSLETRCWGWNDIPINQVVTSDNTLNIVCKIAVCEVTTNAFYLDRTDTAINPENNRSLDIFPPTENSEISDVILILSKTGKKYPAIKAKLAANSPVFAAMFNISHIKQVEKIDQINITDVDSEPVFDELLKYIHASKYENTENLTPDLLVAAHKYELDRLKELCVEKISSNLTVANAVEMLNLADKHGIDKLKSNAIRFIAANYAEISNTTEWKRIVETNSRFVHNVCQVLWNNSMGDTEISKE